MNWSEFFHMGGYGFFVWSSYGLAVIVLALNIIIPIVTGRQLRCELAGRLRREQEK